MATGRRGRFGRRPNGGGGNLSALIASLIREQRAAEDRAIFDAYNNGGLFEGKPVTDDRLLGYIQGRRDQFDKADPLWDQWNNSYIQQKFTIGEQKIGLAYKQGKVKAGAVAAFYRGQLASIPKDSAFYREVAGRAAEWAKAAKAASGGGGGRRGSGSGGGGKSAYKLYQEAGDALEAQKAANLYVDYAIRDALARDGYTLPANQDVLSVGADIINDLFNSGKVVGPNGTISLSDWQQTATNLDTAYKNAITATANAGYQYAHLIDDRRDFQTSTLTKLPTLPFQVRAEAVYDLLNDRLKAANGDPGLIAAAYADAGVMMNSVATAAQKAGADPEVVSALSNDVLTLAGKPTKGDSMLDILMGQNAATGQSRWVFLEPDQGVASASAQVTADLTSNTEAQKLVGSGKGYLVQDSETGALVPVDSAIQPTGTLGQDYQATFVTINGVPTQVYLHGTPVLANLDKDGNPLPDPRTVPSGSARPQFLLGYQFTYEQSGQTVTAWAVRNPATGALTFTKTNPFLGNTTDTGTAIIVSPDTEFPSPVAGPGGYVSQTVVASEGTATLAIDPTATEAIVSNPERAYQQVLAGKISESLFVQAISPNAPAGTTAEQAIVKFQSDRAIAGPNADTGSEAAGIRNSVAQQGTTLAKSIIGNLTAIRPDAAVNSPYAPPTVTVAPQQDWQTAFRASEKTLGVPPSAPTPTYTGIPTAPAPVVAPTIAPKQITPMLKPPTTAGISFTGIPTPPKIVTPPTTTRITTGPYTGKPIPL